MVQTDAEQTVVATGLMHAFGTGEARTAVLKGLDLAVAPGMMVVLTGPSGSGKTTLLTLMGALRATQAGKLRVLGNDLTAQDAAGLVNVRRQIGFIFQNHNLLEALTAQENVMVSARMAYGDEKEAWAKSGAALERVGLADRMDRKPRQLSGGQRQRVAIARALVGKPRLVLADEPTAALDANMSAQMIGLLRETAQRDGATVLVVSHDRRVIEAADRLIHLFDGRIVADLMIQESLEICLFLKGCDFAQDLSPTLLADLSEKVKVLKYEAGAKVVEKGDMVERFFVVREGVVEVRGEGGAVEVGPGKSFAEGALYSKDVSSVSATARGEVTLYAIDGGEYNRTLDAALNQRAQALSLLIGRTGERESGGK